VTVPTGNDQCGAAHQKVDTPVTAGRPRSGPLSATVLGTLSCAVADDVTESDTAAGNIDTLATCARTALPCGLGASTFRLNSAIVT